MVVVFTPSLFCLLYVGIDLAVATCDIAAFNTRTFDALRKVESNGSICKITGGKLGPYQISEQYYNNSGIGNFGKGWQYVWGKGSQSYSEMIIKSYICKHRSSDNDLAPVSVALIHRFGTVTVNLSSMEVRKFRDQIREGVNSLSDSTNECKPECNLGQCCKRRKCMCLNTTTLEVKECKTAPDQVPNVLVDNDCIKINKRSVPLTLSWGEPFNNLDPIVNYTVSCSGDVTCPSNFTTTDNTTRSYTITNLTPMTNYTFSVVATNSIGSGEAGVVMITTPSSLPNITTQPVSITFKVRDVNVIAMSCLAVGMCPIYYQWEKYDSFNNDWISSSHRDVNITSPDLKFSVIREEDEGVYHCIVTNDDGSVISDNATFHVYGPPVIKFISNHTMSPEGDKVNLICSVVNDVDAIHPLQIYWYKGDKPMTPNGKHIILYNETDNASRLVNSTLLLDPVNRTDDGVYTCRAFNRNDSFSESNTTLTVQYPPFVLIENESPYMTNVGSLAVLYCRATGNPIPRVQWYKDDTAVNPVSTPFQQVFIVPTDMPHTTVFTCKGTNYIENMKHTRSANVTVTVTVKVAKACLPLPDAPVNGIRTIIRVPGITKSISFSCNLNYVLKGQSFAVCINGAWSSSTPTCNKL